MANVTFSYGAGLNDSIFGKWQAPISKFIEHKAEQFEQNDVLKQIFNIEKANHFAETITSMGGMEDWETTPENGAHPTNGMQETYKKIFEFETWKSSFSVSREAIDDAKLLDLQKAPNAFTTAYYRTRQRFGAALMGSAITGATYVNFAKAKFLTTTADGLCLYSTAHTNKIKGANQSNLYSDVFSNDALMAAESAMQDFRGDNNEVLDLAPDTILIPNLYALKKTVFAAIGSDKDPATANNGFNYNFGRWNVIVWPYLNQFITSGTAPWVLMDSQYNKNYGGSYLFDRVALEVHSYKDENTDANVWNGYARYGGGFYDWRAFSVGGVSGGTALISA